MTTVNMSAAVAALQADTSPVQPVSHKPAKAPRYAFIDVLRGLALVVMIETHIVNSYLPVGERHSLFFFWLTFFNGLVAPTFLFASGFSLMLQANRQWDDWIHFRAPFWRQMRRLGFITLVAYYSHLQGFRMSRYLHPDVPSLWLDTLQVDVLQCIVASLLVIHGLMALMRRREPFLWAALGLTAGVAMLTPLVWAIDFTRQVPLALALFLNPHGVSLFPVFPWICFVLAGSCASHWFLKGVQSGSEWRYIQWSAVAGVVMIVGGLALRTFPFTLPGRVSFYTTSPLYVGIRLGCVLILCALLYVLERSGRRVPQALRLAGQESLLVYGVHLWVIFGLLRGKHLGPVLGKEAGYPGCIVLSAAVIASMLWLAGGWNSLKRNHLAFVKPAQAATVAIMILVFALR